MKKKIVATILTVLSLILTLLTVYALIPLQSSVGAVKPVPLVGMDPILIPKFATELTGPPPVYVPTSGNNYDVDMVDNLQQAILPQTDFGYGPNLLTPVWGYGGLAKDAITGISLGYQANSPGPSFDVNKDTAITVKYHNKITTSQQFAVDPTLHWANPSNQPMPQPPYLMYPNLYGWAQSPVPLVPHLHGGEVPPASDGGPDAWWTSPGATGAIRGMGFSSVTTPGVNDDWADYFYPNINPASTLWYHDHALGITRLNVMSGLAGFYIVRDTSLTSTSIVDAGITGKYDMPLVFQDRNFNTDGSLLFPALGVQPQVHPYWIPEFFGEVIMVNGKAWPNMNVDDAVYRFRLLDGSNARFYTISFLVTASSNPALVGTYRPFTIIASDGGYLQAPVAPAGPIPQFTFAPGERVEILMDFSGLPTGTTILVQNTANENFPNGLPVNPLTAGQVMQFTVTPDVNTDSNWPSLPTPLNPTLPGATFPTLGAPNYYRMLTLVEILDPVTKVPIELVLDGQKWGAPPTELAQVGSTEEWIIYNPTADSHPIHLHLVQFQLISRQVFNAKAYYDDWLKANGKVLPLAAATKNIMSWPKQYKVGPAVGPLPEEQGWKDTVMVHPGQITRIRVRFAPVTWTGVVNPGDNIYQSQHGFDPTAPHGGVGTIPGKEGPIAYGYVWHCHILDHEDNEMMRPLQIVSTAPSGGYAAPPLWPVLGSQKPLPPA